MKDSKLHKYILDIIADKKITKRELAEMLGITRMTLDVRLKKGNWKKAEVALLKIIIA